MTLAAGTRLGKYEVERLLGAGGMGEVYLARDTQLGRRVALKVLPREVAADAARMQRFTQEAQAASSLDHQNIIVIHDIGEEAGAHFIASEYVRGETLRERTARGNLPVAEVLSVGMQAASALAAAHEAGVVHRDVKPENVMLRPDGFVKVLDFGLAKLAEGSAGVGADSAAPTRALVQTAPGAVMGTVSYMSPEQAAGLADVDERTDVWSLGVLLYEMLAGRVPFWSEGATPTQVLSMIIQREAPPLKQFAPGVPDELNRIVMKALESSRDDRYQSMKEMLVDLRRLSRQLEREAEDGRSVAPKAGAGPGMATAAGAQSQAGVARSGGARPAASTADVAPARQTSSAEVLIGGIRRHKKGVAAAGLVLALALGGLAYGLYKLLARKPAPFRSIKIEKLTNIGNATTAQISPDGQYVAHAVYEGGKYSLRVWHVSTKSGVEIVPPEEDFLAVRAFSPDSRYIYYSKSAPPRGRPALYQIAVLGGASQKILERTGFGISFSPDGRRFAFVRAEPGRWENSLIIANADGTGEQTLATRRGDERFGLDGPSWSPDGRVLATGVYTDGTNMTVAAVSVADGKVVPVTSRKWLNVYRLAWMRDNSGILFSATAQTNQIWYVSYPEGVVRRVTDDTNSYGTGSFSMTADSSTIATLQDNSIHDLFVAPVAEAARARQITPGVGGRVPALGMSWTPDGRIVYATGPGGNTDIWIMGADGTGNRQLTSGPGRDDDPEVSPDGRHIVFASTRSGRLNLWRMDLDGGNLKQLTDGGRDAFPQFSPDGRWVVYFSEVTSELLKVPLDGGESVRLTDRPVLRAAVSRADGRIAGLYRPDENSPWLVAVFPPDGGAPVKTFDPAPGALNADMHWTPDGRSVIYVMDRARSSSLWSQPADGGAPKLLADFSPEQVLSFAVSRDGRWIALARGTVIRDVVLITEAEQ